MADPITLTGLLVGAICGIPGGVLANRADSVVCRFGKEFVASLTEVGVPRNHDALRAMRRAQLDALGSLGKALRAGKAVITPADTFDCGAFLPQLDKFLQREEAAAERLALTDGLAKALAASMDAALAAPSSGTGRARLESFAARAASCVWDEIGPLDPPSAFRTLFDGREPGVPSWFQAYGVFLGQALKKDADFRAIFIADRLANTLEEVVDFREAVDSFIADSGRRHGELTSMLARTETKVDDVKADTAAIRDGVAEFATAREESRTQFQQILAFLQAQRAAGITPNPSPQDRHAIEDAITSRDPERRRAAYLARGILNMARATHELVLELRQLRPALDRFQQVNDEFSDAMFEGDLLEFEGNLDEAIAQYERAVALKTSDGFAAVALANALMDRALKQAPDGQNWDPGRDEWGDSMGRVGSILLPFLEAGYIPSNPAFLPAAWSYAQLWYHIAEAGVTRREAIERSMQGLVTAEQVEPSNPVTLRLLGRNFHKFTNAPSQRAETYFKRAIDADRDDIKQKFYYALFLTESSRDSDAATVFEQCLDMGPDDPHVLEAFAYLLSRDPASQAQAELLWRHALRIWPKHAVGWKRYGRFLASIPGAPSRAEKVFQDGLMNRPNDAGLWCEYAVLLEEQPGREKDAIAAYEKVLVLSPNAVEPNVRLVMNKILAGVFDQPDTAGLAVVNLGLSRNDTRMIIAGGWLGVLYSSGETQSEALSLLKTLKEDFGKPLEFLIQSKAINLAKAPGNKFASWLDSLCQVIAGELPLTALDGWDAWEAA